MNEQRTLVLDDEGPTKVDVRRPRTGRSSMRTGGASSAGASLRRVQLAGGAAVLVLLAGLLAVARQEQQSSRALRQILEELRRERATVSVPYRPELAGEEASRTHPGPESEAAGASVSESRIQLETKAASALVANDYRLALPLYRALARVSKEPVFAYVAGILEARVRCASREGATGSPCP